MRVLALSAGTLCFSSAANAAETSDVFARSSPWTVEYDADSCKLEAWFGPEQSRVTLMLTWFQPDRAPYLQLAGQRFKSGQAQATPRVDFAPYGDPEWTNAHFAISGSTPALVLDRQIPLASRKRDAPNHAPGSTPAERHLEDAVDGARISGIPRGSIELQTGKLAKPMAAIRTCLHDLVKYWGYDPDEQASLSRAPKVKFQASLAHELRDSYPRGSNSAGYNDAFVQFRADLTETGQVRGCHVLYRVTEAKKPDPYSDLVCSAVKRLASFEPALDAAGKPVASFHVARVIFRVN